VKSFFHLPNIYPNCSLQGFLSKYGTYDVVSWLCGAPIIYTEKYISTICAATVCLPEIAGSGFICFYLFFMGSESAVSL
jgi:hypothetical protein